MTLEQCALVVSIVGAVLAILAIIQAVVLRQRTRKETNQSLSFLTNLIINSAADPDVIRKVVEDYNKNKEWRTKVRRMSDGKYILESHGGAAGRFSLKNGKDK